MRTNVTRDFLEIYVIRQPGGPYWEKVYSRHRSEFFPMRTDLGW